jgi:hypothetical protein
VRPRTRAGLPSPEPGGPEGPSRGGGCVEVRRLADGRVAMRRSTGPDGPELVLPAVEMARFGSGVKAGAADFLL